MVTSTVVVEKSNGAVTIEYAGGDSVRVSVCPTKGETGAVVPLEDLHNGVNVVRKARKNLQDQLRRDILGH